MAKSCNAFKLALLKICQKHKLESIHIVDGLGNIYQMHKTIRQMGLDGKRQRKAPQQSCIKKQLDFYFACCARRNPNIYPVCLAMEPAEGDISHL